MVFLGKRSAKPAATTDLTTDPLLWRPRGDTGADSDSGADFSGNVSTRAMARLPRQGNCVWLSALASQPLNSSPCTGKKAKPSTVMSEDWFIQSGKRVSEPNLPLVAEFGSHHRMTYSTQRDNKNVLARAAGAGVFPRRAGVDNPPNVLYATQKGGSSLVTSPYRLGETDEESRRRLVSIRPATGAARLWNPRKFRVSNRTTPTQPEKPQMEPRVTVA